MVYLIWLIEQTDGDIMDKYTEDFISQCGYNISLAQYDHIEATLKNY